MIKEQIITERIIREIMKIQVVKDIIAMTTETILGTIIGTTIEI